jgi:hypothetical protein
MPFRFGIVAIRAGFQSGMTGDGGKGGRVRVRNLRTTCFARVAAKPPTRPLVPFRGQGNKGRQPPEAIFVKIATFPLKFFLSPSYSFHFSIEQNLFHWFFVVFLKILILIICLFEQIELIKKLVSFSFNDSIRNRENGMTNKRVWY